ncbi:hypothetical protein PR048_005255 [Dryococelus australis]|uniref:Uncharacterized protein n=1 Tax=Dryococelus australis TaxID=614101 RepID=A0ABQ9I8R2_9NEOP|nr:hypothetical protein PR048_005255 [Dryococelus australis]
MSLKGRLLNELDEFMLRNPKDKLDCFNLHSILNTALTKKALPQSRHTSDISSHNPLVENPTSAPSKKIAIQSSRNRTKICQPNASTYQSLNIRYETLNLDVLDCRVNLLTRQKVLQRKGRKKKHDMNADYCEHRLTAAETDLKARSPTYWMRLLMSRKDSTWEPPSTSFSTASSPELTTSMCATGVVGSARVAEHCCYARRSIHRSDTYNVGMVKQIWLTLQILLEQRMMVHLAMPIELLCRLLNYCDPPEEVDSAASTMTGEVDCVALMEVDTARDVSLAAEEVDGEKPFVGNIHSNLIIGTGSNQLAMMKVHGSMIVVVERKPFLFAIHLRVDIAHKWFLAINFFSCDGYVPRSIYSHQCNTIDFFRHGAGSTVHFFGWVTYSRSDIAMFRYDVKSATDLYGQATCNSSIAIAKWTIILCSSSISMISEFMGHGDKVMVTGLQYGGWAMPTKMVVAYEDGGCLPRWRSPTKVVASRDREEELRCRPPAMISPGHIKKSTKILKDVEETVYRSQSAGVSLQETVGRRLSAGDCLSVGNSQQDSDCGEVLLWICEDFGVIAKHL